MDQARNPAKHLEQLATDMLAQRIFAVDFAWGFTLLERHLATLGPWLAALGELEGPAGLARERARAGLAELDEAMGQLRRFVEEGELADLDRGLATARQAAWTLEEAFAAARPLGPPMGEFPERARLAPAGRDWQRDWAAAVTRHQGCSRATFTCRTCGWELSFVQEAEAGEWEIPFSEILCPLCHPG